MKIRKYHPHKSVLFVTFSVEEGLLFLSNPLCQSIVQSCLASAQALYPLSINHFVIQATHMHLLLTVDDPNDVESFMRHFKTESAHLINGVLGRDKRTVWCEGYDSPIVLDIDKAIEKIVYIYTNPVKDNLVESIDSFPGLSSWKMFNKEEHEKTWKRLRRPAVNTLQYHSPRSYMQEAKRLLKESKEELTFRIEPNTWLEAFGITDVNEQKAKNQEIIESVKDSERSLAEERIQSKSSVMGKDRLISQLIDPNYRPKRSGRRMCCLSTDRTLRKEFINFLKDLYSQAREVYERWRLGDVSTPFPLGLYPPSFPKLVEPLAAW